MIEPTPNTNLLSAEIADTRGVGSLTVKIESLPLTLEQSLPRWLRDEPNSLPNVLDIFCMGLGFARLGDKWTERNAEDAKLHVEQTLARDMVYATETMDIAAAQKFASLFFGWFDTSFRSFTNSTSVANSGEPFTFWPIEGSNIDTGIVCLDNAHIGILWVGDNS